MRCCVYYERLPMTMYYNNYKYVARNRNGKVTNGGSTQVLWIKWDYKTVNVYDSV